MVISHWAKTEVLIRSTEVLIRSAVALIRSTKVLIRSTEVLIRSTEVLIRSTEVLIRSVVALIRSTEVLIRDVPAHAMTEVPCHLILGLRHSYDYMYSETSHLYYWGMNFAPIEGGEVRYVFPLISSFSILPICEF